MCIQLAPPSTPHAPSHYYASVSTHQGAVVRRKLAKHRPSRAGGVVHANRPRTLAVWRGQQARQLVVERQRANTLETLCAWGIEWNLNKSVPFVLCMSQ